MKEETTLFFDSIMREDRSVMDLLDADYTFVNERLARHYGIPNIYGSQFRRVKVPSDARRGLLGQASVLTVTSYPNRTSPVERGKWVLTNLLGVPPQPPPPNVPPLQETLRVTAESSRCASAWRSTAPIRYVRDVIGRWTRLASRSRTSMAWVNGEPVTRAGRSIRRARSSTAPR